MRIIAILTILSLLLGGYVPAAKAFGLVPSCTKSVMAAQGMKDCCDPNGKMKDGRAKPGNCLSCQCCAAAVSPPALPAVVFAFQAFPASPEYTASDQVSAADFNYLPLRPPNSLA